MNRKVDQCRYLKNDNKLTNARKFLHQEIFRKE